MIQTPAIQSATLIALCAALNLIAACAGSPPRVTIAQAESVIASPDRTEADRTNDIRRQAVQLLAFIDARPGMRALDLSAGGGYTSELLARSVGPQGRVWSQITPAAKEGPGGAASGDANDNTADAKCGDGDPPV